MTASMIYELRRPAEIASGKTYPALFVMHGIGSNESNMLSLVEGLEKSMFVFCIRGPISYESGFAYFTVERFGKPHQTVFDEAVLRLINFIDEACAEYPIDRDGLYLLGFSQGAILSMTLSLMLGDRVSGIVALSGYIPDFVKENDSLQSVRHLSAFISHGEIDDVLPFEWGRANAAFFETLGADVTFRTYPEKHRVSRDNRREFHQWFEQVLPGR